MLLIHKPCFLIIIISFKNEYNVLSFPALKEHFKKNMSDWKILTPKEFSFDLLNENTAYVLRKVKSIDEKSGRVKLSYR